MRFREHRITSYEPLNEPLPDEASGRSSVVIILAATAVAGIAGYVVTWRVASTIGANAYGVFSVFWSALFLVVGILFGLQQEATRAVAETSAGSQRGRASIAVLAPVLAVVVLLAVLATSLLWAPPSLGSAHSGLVWPIAIGAALNCLVAAVSGVLAGSQSWRRLAAIVAVDGVLRVVGVLIVLAFTHDVNALAWAVVIPFPLALLIVFATAPRTIIERARVSIGYRALAKHVSQTMLAASATAVLINGFPLILSFFTAPSDHSTLGSLILAVTLTRAPILVPLMALSSFLVTRFSLHPEAVGRTIALLFLGIAAVIGLLSVLTALWGPQFMKVIFGNDFALPSSVLVPLVASSGLIGALCVSGPAVLARGMHGVYAWGWIIASVVAIALLFLPIQLNGRAALALSIGPAVGLCVHLLSLRSRPVEIARSSLTGV